MPSPCCAANGRSSAARCAWPSSATARCANSSPGAPGNRESSNPAALAAALGAYLDDPARLRAHGIAARERIERNYSVAAMVGAYTALYDRLRDVTINSEEITRPCAE